VSIHEAVWCASYVEEGFIEDGRAASARMRLKKDDHDYLMHGEILMVCLRSTTHPQFYDTEVAM
jgi:hypothetical protein